MPRKRRKNGGDEEDGELDEEDEKIAAELEEELAEEQLEFKKALEREKREQERKRKEREKRRRPRKKRPKLPVGVIINTDKNRYEVIQVLGAGGFGDVYKVRQIDGAKKGDDTFALKTEMNTAGKALNRLKVEMTILQECDTLPEHKRKHFVKIIDRGRTDSFKFIVMELVGTSIDRLQKKQPKRRFTFSTTVKLGLETLEGIANLHELGYLHRDIKPQNFTIGLREKSTTIYLLDFGIARRYIEKNSKAIRLPREMVRFLGTVRFASRNCHRSREQCRKDDLESWVYMLIEFTEYASLPWSNTIDRDVVCREKERLFSGTYTKHIASLPEEIHRILKYINELNYQNTPDYEYISMLLRRAAARKHASLTIKFDWEESESENAGRMPSSADNKPKQDSTNKIGNFSHQRLSTNAVANCEKEKKLRENIEQHEL